MDLLVEWRAGSILLFPFPFSPFCFLPTLASRFSIYLASPHKNSVVKRVGFHVSPYTLLRALLGSYEFLQRSLLLLLK